MLSVHALALSRPVIQPSRQIHAANDLASSAANERADSHDAELAHALSFGIPGPDQKLIFFDADSRGVASPGSGSRSLQKRSHQFPIVCPATKHCGVSGITEIRRFLTCGSRLPSPRARV
jgi:hypothetical protein